jgi:uncharacterized protein (TIGR02246 family)
MKTEEQAIRDVHTTWVDAANAGDSARMLTLMAADAVFLNPGRAPFGRERFPVSFAAAHQQFAIECISELQEIVIAGDVAYTLSKDSLSITPRAGGVAMQLAGDRLTVYRKQADGHWLLARDANTLTAAVT